VRRLLLLVALSATILATLGMPAAVAAAPARCAVSISPSVGSPTDAFRISVTNVPVDPDGVIEADVIVKNASDRSTTFYFAWLIPGVTEFYIDHNYVYEGEEQTYLAPGRYTVTVETPQVVGPTACHAIGWFTVA